MRAIAWASLSILLLGNGALAAEAADAGAARARLQEGYVLKRQGNCQEAVPHFAESVRLDRTPKALLNLSDCEEKLGQLIFAQAHATEGRDLARELGMSEVEALAQKQLARLDARAPQLILTLANDAPLDSVIFRDGAELARLSCGRPLPIDPGAHVIVVRGGGFERRFDVTLAERDLQAIEVSPLGGESTATPPAVAPENPDERVNDRGSPTLRQDVDPSEPASPGSVQRTVGIVIGAVGATALATSAVLGLSAKAQYTEATRNCPNGSCTRRDDVDRATSAKHLGDVGTGIFVAGGISLVAGTVLWLTAPREGSVALRVVPTGGASAAGVELHGQF
jgi:hypothetical protein